MQLNFKYIGGRIYLVKILFNQLSICPLHKAIEILPKSVLKSVHAFAGNIT